MNITTSSLKSLPYEKWSLLRDSLKRDWPKYAYYYNYLETMIAWQTKNPPLKFNIYCPDANVDSGYFMFISTVGNFQSVYLFAFEGCKQMLNEMLQKTDKISWNETFDFVGIHESIHSVLEDFLNTKAKSKGMSHYKKNPIACYWKSKEDCLKINVEIPKECELKHIEDQHIPLIRSHWHYRDINHPERTIYYLSSLAKLNGGFGLFLKKDGSLVSWVLLCNRGCLAVLNTLEEHRGKGYAKIVTQALAKYKAEKDNVDVTVFIGEDNLASLKLFESMGFKRATGLARYDINQ